jgi:hypothetical protein
MCRELRKVFSSGLGSKMMKPAESYPPLRESPQLGGQDAMMQIIGKRYNDRKLNVFTTN